MSQLSPDDCREVIAALAAAQAALPQAARSMRVKLRTIIREHGKALRACEGAKERGQTNPEIRACGGLEPGEYILLGAGPCRVRRITETGIEIMAPDEGRWTWENVSSRTTPVCVVDSPEVER